MLIQAGDAGQGPCRTKFRQHGLQLHRLGIVLIAVMQCSGDALLQNDDVIYIAPAGMPVEVISVLRDWVKFRDVQGDLSWVNRDLLTDRRMVITRAPETLRREPRAEAEPLVDVAADVLLELVDDKPTGEFARVRDAGGEIGFLPVASVWGL